MRLVPFSDWKKKKKPRSYIKKDRPISTIYLWGQSFISSSEGLRSKSTKALLYVGAPKGDGSLSTSQNRFLANPCDSRGPKFENCSNRKIFTDQDKNNQSKQLSEKKSNTYLRKTNWNPTTNWFRRFEYSLYV